jgi:hypothetical protein
MSSEPELRGSDLRAYRGRSRLSLPPLAFRLLSCLNGNLMETYNQKALSPFQGVSQQVVSESLLLHSILAISVH